MIQSVGRSTPALTLSHSTTTVPLNRAGSVGRITTKRVLYSAVGAERLGRDVPLAVARQRRGRRVARGHTAEEELRPLVADLREIESGPNEMPLEGVTGEITVHDAVTSTSATAAPIRPNFVRNRFCTRTLRPPGPDRNLPSIGRGLTCAGHVLPRRCRELGAAAPWFSSLATHEEVGMVVTSFASSYASSPRRSCTSPHKARRRSRVRRQRSAAATNDGISALQPAVLASRKAAPLAPSRSQPECTISSRVVPSPQVDEGQLDIGRVAAIAADVPEVAEPVRRVPRR